MVTNGKQKSPVISFDSGLANNLKVKTTLCEEFFLTEPMSWKTCERPTKGPAVRGGQTQGAWCLMWRAVQGRTGLERALSV